jgi:hypothetical protein
LQISLGEKTLLNRKKKKILGMVVLFYHPSYCSKPKQEDCSPGWPCQKVRTYKKITRAKKNGGMFKQLSAYLASMKT